MSSSAQPTVLFVHIMKTGGQTVKGIASRHYSLNQITFIQSDTYISEFAQLSLEQRAQPRLLLGHMPYGIHAQMPRPHRYVTMLRDPIERTISHYYFMRRDPTSYMHEAVKDNNWSLADYLRHSHDHMMDNCQVRALSGVWNTVAIGELTDEMLAMACDNLRTQFAVVGLTERFDESLLLMQQVLGWPYVYYRRKINVTVNRPKSQSLDPETLKIIQRRNQLDQQLYKVAQEVFTQQLTAQHVESRLDTVSNRARYLYWWLRYGVSRMLALRRA